jgi:hypothetical protein
LANLQRQSLRRHDFLHSTLLWFEKAAVLSGFIGYPHLLMLLELITDLREKEIFFLGSAGTINPHFKEPIALQVSKIYSSSMFKRFSRKSSLPLKIFPLGSSPSVRGVSVDMIQRETQSWLATQRSRNIDIVEMELFPLRWFLRKPFHALVVLSDRVEETGIRSFCAKEKFNREFTRAFHAIMRYINHEESHPDP